MITLFKLKTNDKTKVLEIKKYLINMINQILYTALIKYTPPRHFRVF